RLRCPGLLTFGAPVSRLGDRRAVPRTSQLVRTPRPPSPRESPRVSGPAAAAAKYHLTEYDPAGNLRVGKYRQSAPGKFAFFAGLPGGWTVRPESKRIGAPCRRQRHQSLPKRR